MRHTFKLGQRAFSLVELMVVVAIIGVLAALAVPKFQNFQAKAKQSEAKNNLSHIYTLQQAYFGDNDTYGNSNTDIGFTVDGKVRYTYAAGGAGATFKATATETKAGTVVAGSTTKDAWTIDQTKQLCVTADATGGAAKCF